MDANSTDFTRLLNELGLGYDRLLPALLPVIYDDLRRLAGHHLRGERGDHTLQPTALVHEVYLKLSAQDRVRWENRSHFIAVASQLMRRILVDHARTRAANKRGGDRTRVALDDDIARTENRDVDLLELDRALTRLAGLDPRQAQIVELRYFGGLSIDETADALSVSPATVKREWQMARAWLHRALQPDA